MIPKIIHYCWFGRKQKPELVKLCIQSWIKICPDYKVIEWNEDNFDLSINEYIQEAYTAEKWAFVTDFGHRHRIDKKFRGFSNGRCLYGV